MILASKLFKKEIFIDWWEVWSFYNWYSYGKLLGAVGYCVQQITLFFVGILKVTIFVDNELDEMKLRKTLGQRHPIYRVTNGVPQEQIDNANHVQASPDVVSLGRLKNHKGVDLLVRAIAIIKNDFGLNIKASIIGDGPEREALERL